MIRLACLNCHGSGSIGGRDFYPLAACPDCEGSGYLLAPPDFAEVVAAVFVFAFVFAAVALFAWWILG